MVSILSKSSFRLLLKSGLSFTCTSESSLQVILSGLFLLNLSLCLLPPGTVDRAVPLARVHKALLKTEQLFQSATVEWLMSVENTV